MDFYLERQKTRTAPPKRQDCSWNCSESQNHQKKPDCISNAVEAQALNDSCWTEEKRRWSFTTDPVPQCWMGTKPNSRPQEVPLTPSVGFSPVKNTGEWWDKQACHHWATPAGQSCHQNGEWHSPRDVWTFLCRELGPPPGRACQHGPRRTTATGHSFHCPRHCLLQKYASSQSEHPFPSSPSR